VNASRPIPRPGREIARVVDASDADVDRAVAAAPHAAFDDGRWTRPAADRARADDPQARRSARGHADELAELESIDNGKPQRHRPATPADMPSRSAMLRYMAGWATKLAARHIEPMATHARGRVPRLCPPRAGRRRAQIVPWNFPLMMAVQKIAPGARRRLHRRPEARRADQPDRAAPRRPGRRGRLPGRRVQHHHRHGRDRRRPAGPHPDVDKVAFTGSTEVGKLINRARPTR
jgi:phenylacetaldehyde dehydrogenase